jgi:acyl-CoA dehydrogenase
MDFDFSDEQRQLRDQLRRALAQDCPLSEARAALEGRIGHSITAWKRLADLGVLASAVPEKLGGSGMGALELCIAAEEIGRQLAPVPFNSSIGLALEAVLRYGSATQKETYAPRLGDGTLIGCVAFGELPGGDIPAGPQTFFDGALSGVKAPVADGSIAGIAIVLARDGDESSLFIANLAQGGIERDALHTVDGSRGHARITFTNATAERLGGVPGGGHAKAGALIERAAVLMAFEQIGGADRALELAVDYAKSREAFGRSIGSYQAIKHKLADIYIKNQIARAHAYYGAWALASEAPELPIAAAGARLSATEAFSFAAQECLQTHGGIGFTWEHDCHLFYRRARLLALELGTRPAWQEHLVDLLEHRNTTSDHRHGLQ